jgi:hypothetical protein
MSDKNWSQPLLLEHLPMKILLQIFALIIPQELVTAFLGLNMYINSIVTSVTHLSFVIKRKEDIELLPFFASRIIRLVIIDSEDEVDLTSLVNLRSLTLIERARAHLHWIRPRNFPLLEIIYVDGGN